MANQNMPSKAGERKKALKAFWTHLGIFLIVNAILLVVPVFYDGAWDFSFEDRGPMLYGSIGWAVGLFFHGVVVFGERLLGGSE